MANAYHGICAMYRGCAAHVDLAYAFLTRPPPLIGQHPHIFRGAFAIPTTTPIPRLSALSVNLAERRGKHRHWHGRKADRHREQGAARIRQRETPAACGEVGTSSRSYGRAFTRRR